ncbi:cell envelope integrity protein TolA [Paucibacter sp. Y2R2-4]|uniref:cell envelope integrity protein TolA n=1 Tax=Paucibacter sp. Y2R2-4 TaxID=2893553 RepID=UPI0021E3D776|nr:cell envelope integrity protein TolA [Paucibacter sp. Y2R2-4]MCV2348491.1 cell envelope integrity protein TolA [Paucibacter sp. Y2R2-4]
MAATLFLRNADPLRPPEAPGLGRGLLFAVIAHAALLAALSAGVQWRTKAPPAFEAELWSAVPQAAAPKEVIPPEPEPEPEVAKPQPKPAPPPPQEDLQAERDAEIAIAKAREQKIKREQEAKRLAEEAERKKQLAAKEKLEREKEEKLKQAKLEKEKLDKQKQAKESKETEARREAKLEAQRQENLKRIQGMAGASGGANATGTALKSSGPSASYAGRIMARIRPNIIYNGAPSGNPVAEVEVRVAPDGAIISRKLLKPSGDADWDKAVLRAIDKTETLPRDTDGRVPPLMVFSFDPREQTL